MFFPLPRLLSLPLLHDGLGSSPPTAERQAISSVRPTAGPLAGPIRLPAGSAVPGCCCRLRARAVAFALAVFFWNGGVSFTAISSVRIRLSFLKTSDLGRLFADRAFGADACQPRRAKASGGTKLNTRNATAAVQPGAAPLRSRARLTDGVRSSENGLPSRPVGRAYQLTLIGTMLFSTEFLCHLRALTVRWILP